MLESQLWETRRSQNNPEIKQTTEIISGKQSTKSYMPDEHNALAAGTSILSPPSLSLGSASSCARVPPPNR